MLGFAPLAAAPFGATGSGGVAYDCAFSDAGVVADTALQAVAAFSPRLTDAAAGIDVLNVTASTFNANASGAASGADTTAAAAAFLSNMSGAAAGLDAYASVAAFLSNISETVTGTDSALVGASNFSATFADAAVGADTVRATTTMPSTFSDAAVVSDENMADFLWATINDSQATTWSVVKTQS